MNPSITAKVTWPSPQDYNEAIQNPQFAFADEDLKLGEVEIDALGLPRPISGNFASVYKLTSGGRTWAVRCFLQEGDQHERYEAISEHFLNQGFKFAVPFSFLREGIRIGNNWFPVLKMEWVDGVTLDQFVREQANSPAKLLWLAEQLKQLVEEMQARKIAHGDLQHANLIIDGDRLLLVDYDGVYVPQLSGLLSAELGHRNYQHPKRSAQDFGPELDNFSIWVIYISLRILAADPGLVKCADEDFESLLFTRDDFVSPDTSVLFHLLEQHRSKEIVRNARLLRAVLKQPYPGIPSLGQRAVVDRCVNRLKPLKPRSTPSTSPWLKALEMARQIHSPPPTAKDPNEQLRFWYPYLLNKYKSKLHFNEGLLFLSVLSTSPFFFLSPQLYPYVVAISSISLGSWIYSCFSLKNASKDFQRAAYILAESQGIPVSYELKMGSSMLGFPEVFVVFQAGEIPSELTNKQWSISNWFVMPDSEKNNLKSHKSSSTNGELYFDPKGNIPIAVFSGNLLLWMI